MIVLYIFGRISFVLLVGTIAMLVIAIVAALIVYFFMSRAKKHTLKAQVKSGQIL